MGIKSFTPGTAGTVGVTPRIFYVWSDDDLATVTSVGYLNSIASNLLPTDIVALTYGNNISQFFTVSFSGSDVTLIQESSGVNLPVINNNFAIFDGTDGTLKDNGFTPATASNDFVVTNNGGMTVGNLPTYLNANGALGDGLIATNKVLNTLVVTPMVNSNVANFDPAVVSAAILQGGAQVPIILGAGLKRYKIRQIRVNAGSGGSTNFSGNSGDRNIVLTDGTNVFTSMSAAFLGTIINSTWGSAGVPYPAFAPNAPSVAGATIYLAYDGGTEDYAAGNLSITMEIERVV